MSALNRFVAKKRIAELENRLNNLHKLVENIAFNQEQIVAALSPKEEEVKPKPKKKAVAKKSK
tara:strand:+ start:1271 stop:1459 length:189 start_codon:yes stop_codon:yes gene_type:complete